jgi:hypothetical protein
MELSHREFIDAFEQCRAEPFHHADHLRVAWIYLQHFDYGDAERRLAEGLRRFAASKGASEKYHETMTRAWMRLVASASGDGESFDAVIARHPELLDQKALARFYSAARLAQPEAREGWLEPDLEPLPPCRFV